MSDIQKNWRCTVCGFVHNGPEPPDVCPVCGATKDLFERYNDSTESQSKVTVSQWRCLNCEYIHDGSSAPNACSVCGAPAERFEPYSKSETKTLQSKDKLRIVIVGAGIAGVSAAEAARETSINADITLISKEPHLPYYRLNLTRYLAGEIDEEQLPLHQQNWYDEKNIEIINKGELCTIETGANTIQLRDDKIIDYDRLILTVGSHPFVPSVPGVSKEIVTVLRTKDAADYILDQCKPSLRCVVIGGGLLGLETAGALAKHNVDVTLLEGHGWLMPRQLNETAGVLLEQHAKGAGIKLRKNARTREIQGDTRVRGVLLDDNTVIPAELVVITTGVRSNSYVARLSEGIEVNKGIVVGNSLQSSKSNIYAAGDVAEHRGEVYGTWGPSQFQGTIAGINSI